MNADVHTCLKLLDYTGPDIDDEAVHLYQQSAAVFHKASWL